MLIIRQVIHNFSPRSVNENKGNCLSTHKKSLIYRACANNEHLLGEVSSLNKYIQKVYLRTCHLETHVNELKINKKNDIFYK